MLDKIVEMVVAQAKQTPGQNAAARLHSVLMDVGNAVGRIIAAEQAKERARGNMKSGSKRNAGHS